MIRVNIHEAKTHFSKLIKKVFDDEKIIIAKSNTPVAKSVHISTSEKKTQVGFG